MQHFKKDDFLRTGNETHLGARYDNYWLVELLHKRSNKKMDIIMDPAGNAIAAPDGVTDRIRTNYCINGTHAKIVPITIENQMVLILKWPSL